MRILELEVQQFFTEEWGTEGIVDLRTSMIECLSRTAIRSLMAAGLLAKRHEHASGHTSCTLLHTHDVVMRTTRGPPRGSDETRQAADFTDLRSCSWNG